MPRSRGLALLPASVQPTIAFAWPCPMPYSDLRWPTIAMCLSRPHFTIIFCHSEIGRPYFFSIDGKYEAGPCLGRGAENSGRVNLLLPDSARIQLRSRVALQNTSSSPSALDQWHSRRVGPLTARCAMLCSTDLGRSSSISSRDETPIWRQGRGDPT